MKFFAVLALFVAVAQASLLLPGSIPTGPASVDQEQSEIQEILAAINHPSTDPATAAALEEMLFDILGINKEPIVAEPAIVDEYQPISVGPAIVDGNQPISVGPAIVDGYQPISVGPAIVDEYQPISVGPAIVAPPAAVPAESSSAPLVQIILNINNGQSGAIAGSPVAVEGLPSAINPSPVAVVDNEITPTPVAVVDTPINPTPVVVVDPIEPTPVIVEELAPEPILIGTPILPSPVAILPEELN